MKYTVIDIETNGLYFKEGHEITEIAAIEVVNGSVIKSFSSLVRLKGEISPFITNLTGINKEMTNNADLFQDVIMTFINTINLKNVVVHNKDFDINFIKYWLKQYKINDIFAKSRFICTLELARKKLPYQSHKLENLKKKFGIKTKSHRALNDVLVTNKIYKELLKIGGKKDEELC